MAIERIVRHGRSLLAALPWLLVAQMVYAIEPPKVEAPVTYVSCDHQGPTVSLNDTPSGPRVTVRRSGQPDITTLDANLAHRSRRLFFKLRDERAIVEFQGRATSTALEGLLSEGDESRHIRLVAAAIGACKDR